jgi:hypothetical protein
MTPLKSRLLSQVFTPVCDNPIESPNPVLQEAVKLIKSGILKSVRQRLE